MMLDLESVRLFVMAAEYGNLTRAAEAAGTVQPAVSQRIKSLENRLGRKLLDRSPRFVRLTDAGASFLVHAKTLLAAHDAALTDGGETPTVSLGISDHVLGTALPELLRSLKLGLTARTRISVRLGLSHEMRDLYDRRIVDVAVLRKDSGADNDGEVLGEDALGWFGDISGPAGEQALPLVLLPPPCGVRATALEAVQRSGLPWREAFTGGSCLALAAAVQAGAGIAPLGRLTASGLPPYIDRASLPDLPTSRIVMLARTPEPHHAGAAKAVAACVRTLLRA